MIQTIKALVVGIFLTTCCPLSAFQINDDGIIYVDPSETHNYLNIVLDDQYFPAGTIFVTGGRDDGWPLATENCSFKKTELYVTSDEIKNGTKQSEISSIINPLMCKFSNIVKPHYLNIIQLAIFTTDRRRAIIQYPLTETPIPEVSCNARVASNMDFGFVKKNNDMPEAVGSILVDCSQPVTLRLTVNDNNSLHLADGVIAFTYPSVVEIDTDLSPLNIQIVGRMHIIPEAAGSYQASTSIKIEYD
ncbi:hypothetical protein ABUU69_001254 [Vibrio cholerae]|nr:hypothetical protein [Vibrio cholerae]